MQRIAGSPPPSPSPNRPARIRFKHHGYMNNVADPNQKKCDYCQKLFRSQESLDNHQSRTTTNNFGCHRLQTNTRKQAARDEIQERNENIKSFKLQKNNINVSQGPHPKGSLITAKEKKCILNLYQSYVDEKMPEKEAREQTCKRLQFGDESVRNIIKEFIYERKVEDNKSIKMTSNAYEKLDDETVDELRKLIHAEMLKCNVKRMTEENQDATYLTIGNLHKIVLDTGRFPNWSYNTFREVLLGMNIKMKGKSEVDRAILLEDENIIKWRKRYLENMEKYRLEGRTIFYVDETAFDTRSQPKKMLTDCTVLSAKDANERELSTGYKWNCGRGNRLLVLHIIGPDGFLKHLKKIWIRKSGKILCDDYHNDIDAKTFYDWFKEVLKELPDHSVVVMDNASIHNKRAEGTPKSGSYKADMQAWLIEHDIDFEPDATRPKLWEIIKEELKNFPEYCIDKLTAECGKDIIIERTPPYHCELNPIEMC